MSRFEAGVTGSPRDAPEAKWLLGGVIEIQRSHKVYGKINQKAICAKKHQGGLKSGINFVLEPKCVYIRVSLYPDGPLFGVLRE